VLPLICFAVIGFYGFTARKHEKALISAIRRTE
jgi:hypothetical protein